MGFGGGPPSTIDVAQMSTDNASYLTVIGRDGTTVTMPADMTTQYPVLSPPPGQNPIPAFPAAPPGAPQPERLTPLGLIGPTANRLPPAHGRAMSADPRAWIANILVTPKNRSTLAAARTRFLGTPVERVGKLDRYVHERNGTTVEELVDPTIGATVERNIARNGKLLVHLTRSYADAGGGRYILHQIRIETASVNPAQPRATEITLDNVHLETRGSH